MTVICTYRKGNRTRPKEKNTMNDKTREQIEAMKKQTIGVEIEMNNITREKAARKVADYFGTTAWYAAAQYGYMSWACKDQQGRVWKFQRDISIHGPDSEKCELVTPILTYDDMRPCRKSSDCFAGRVQSPAPAEDAEFTSTSARATTMQRPCGIWSTSWQPTRSKSAERFASTRDAPVTIAKWSTTASSKS